MADYSMGEEFFEYFIDQEGLTTNNKLDEDTYHDKIHEHLDNFVSYEVDYRDVRKYVNEFGVFNAIQMSIDNFGELQMPYLDENERTIDQNLMYRKLLYVILYEIANQGYDEIYELVEMKEGNEEADRNETIDSINLLSQMIIGF
jgi:hypothetical protein